ncbi:PorV/PorQ family protein [candidate division WOR-3 bacterium]|nr:PorV/PorQ family protein [candidate division WOR-3 bacterium]
MRYLRLLAVIVILFCGVSQAGIINDIKEFFESKSDGVGLPLLKLEVGARNLALGGGILSRDATLLFWNPSQIPLVSGLSATFSHTSQVIGTRYEFAGVVWGDGKHGFGVGSIYFSAGDIELRDSRQALYGDYSPFSLVSYLSYARKMGEVWLGGTYKYIYERCYVYSLKGYAVDLGFNYVPINNLYVSFVATNIGPRPSYNIDGSTPIRLPLTFNFSSGYEIKKFGFSTSFRKALDEVLTSSFGVEYSLNSYITLRMGKRFGFDSKDASFGFGINYSNYTFDYTYLPFEYDLGNSHHITITLK